MTHFEQHHLRSPTHTHTYCYTHIYTLHAHSQPTLFSCFDLLLCDALFTSKTSWKINTSTYCARLRLLIIRRAEDGLCTSLFSSEYITHFSQQLLWRAAVVVRNDTFHKEEEWELNVLLASLLLVIQICHRVHTLFNGTFLCFQVPSAPLFMIMHFWAPQFSYYPKLVVTTDCKSHL